jgi:uncharacterized protein YybS (DUF2232 family)
MAQLPGENGDDNRPDWDSWVDGDPDAATKPTPQNITPDNISAQTISASSAKLPVPDPNPIVLVETAFLASTAGLIWLINYYFPLGPFLRLCLPIPIALIYLRRGRRAAWMAALVASLLSAVLMGPTRSILFLIPFGFLGVLLGVCWRRGSPWLTSIGLGTLLTSFGVFFQIWLTSILLSEDLWVYYAVQVTKLLDWVFLRLGLLIQPSILLVQVFTISLIVLNSGFYLFTVHLLALLILERLGSPIPPPPRWVQTILDEN